MKDILSPLKLSVGDTRQIGGFTIKVISINGSEVNLEVVKFGRLHSSKRAKNQASTSVNKLSDSEQFKGCVHKLDNKKGFGFIYSAGVTDSIYFHISSIEGQSFKHIHEGSEVEFIIDKEGPRGDRAINVRLLD